MPQLNRRSFLAGVAALAATPAAGAPAASAEIDAVVVGAGPAGIAAARRLRSHQRSVQVVEAAARVGGRCATDTATFGVPFDLGAHWLYAPGDNPLARAAPRTGIDIYPAPRGQRMRIGRRFAREGELEDYLASLVRCSRALSEAARGKSDISAAKALPSDLGGWRRTIDFVLGAYGCGGDLADVSAADLSRSMERDTASFCRQGLGALVVRLAEGLPVRLSTPVSQIEFAPRNARVEVTTPSGRIAAKYVIVTASPNLVSSGRIAFAPELPKRQLDALAGLKTAHMEHIALDLPGNPLALQRDDLMFERADGAETAALLAGVSGSALGVVTIGGRFAAGLAAKGEAAMTEFAVEWLSGLFGTDLKKSVRRSRATRWAADPWAMGAGVYAATGAQGSRRILMEPVRDRLYFAGDALHDTLWGTVGGAWESGERSADLVLRRLGAIKDPEAAAARPDRKAPSPRRRGRKRNR